MEHLFDHEKLDVYQLELEFLSWASTFIDDIARIASMLTKLVQRFDTKSS